MWIETARTPRESATLVNLDHVHLLEVGRKTGGAYEVCATHPGGQVTLSSWFTREEAEAFVEVLRDKIQAIPQDALTTEALARRAHGSSAEAARNGGGDAEEAQDDEEGRQEIIGDAVLIGERGGPLNDGR